MANQELYDKVCKVLTWYEHPDEYPFGTKNFDKEIASEMYKTLAEVQNELFDN